MPVPLKDFWALLNVLVLTRRTFTFATNRSFLREDRGPGGLERDFEATCTPNEGGWRASALDSDYHPGSRARAGHGGRSNLRTPPERVPLTAHHELEARIQQLVDEKR